MSRTINNTQERTIQITKIIGLDNGKIADALSYGVPGLPLFRRTVPAAWVDYNGHMSEFRYLEAFCEATDALLLSLGMDEAYVVAGHSYFTVETHLRHLNEAFEGDVIDICTQLVGSDAKRLHLFHSLYRSENGTVAATAEQMLLHVDRGAGRAVAAQGKVSASVSFLTKNHAMLPVPDGSGRSVSSVRSD